MEIPRITADKSAFTFLTQGVPTREKAVGSGLELSALMTLVNNPAALKKIVASTSVFAHAGVGTAVLTPLGNLTGVFAISFKWIDLVANGKTGKKAQSYLLIRCALFQVTKTCVASLPRNFAEHWHTRNLYPSFDSGVSILVRFEAVKMRLEIDLRCGKEESPGVVAALKELVQDLQQYKQNSRFARNGRSKGADKGLRRSPPPGDWALILQARVDAYALYKQASQGLLPTETNWVELTEETIAVHVGCICSKCGKDPICGVKMQCEEKGCEAALCDRCWRGHDRTHSLVCSRTASAESRRIACDLGTKTPMWKAQAILDHRVHKTRPTEAALNTYYIEWEGPWQHSWETIADLSWTMETPMMAAYWKKVREQEAKTRKRRATRATNKAQRAAQRAKTTATMKTAATTKKTKSTVPTTALRDNAPEEVARGSGASSGACRR